MSELRYNIFLNKTSKKFSDRGFEAILAITLGLASLGLLLLFPIAGIALATFASCFLCVGIKSYLLSISKEEFLPIESIFYSFKICIKAFCLKVAVWLITFLWGIIFIIPGIICALNYSMASFVMAEDRDLSALECMAKSKKIVYGYRFEIFIIYLCYFLVSLVALSLFGAIGIAIQFYTGIAFWFLILLVTLMFAFVLVVLIIPYFELMFANIYLEISKQQKKSRQPKSSKRALKEQVE